MTDQLRIPSERVRASKLSITDLDFLMLDAEELGISVHRDADTEELIFTDQGEPDKWAEEYEEWQDDCAEDNWAVYMAKTEREAKEATYGGEPA